MRRLLILSAGATLALTSAVSAAPATQPLTISKECSQFTGEVPSFCTITESNLSAIPVGTKILYYGPVVANPLFSSSTAVIAVGNGDSAVGYCVVYDSASPPVGTCAFHAGGGTLAGFQAIVKVTVDDKQIWHWDGGYVLGVAAAAK
ncbi:hypothetical protein [Ensifer sp.]|jgi:hypothetical protein|uniref:hypothetical protein n=1 Tax=Ensifer sp. TaxID=1872086 RepID=UPI002E1668A9|nr:hypothetical protein [Ensifer sp.]